MLPVAGQAPAWPRFRLHPDIGPATAQFGILRQQFEDFDRPDQEAMGCVGISREQEIFSRLQIAVSLPREEVAAH